MAATLDRTRRQDRWTYPDGREARLGDKVCLGDAEGTVICAIDSGDYSPDHPASEWSFLQRGIVVAFEAYGLIHYGKAEEDLRLVELAACAT